MTSKQTKTRKPTAMVRPTSEPQPAKKTGQPSRTPDPAVLERLPIARLLNDDLRRILLKCNAPSHWDDHEVRLLVNLCFFPGMFNAVDVKRSPSGVSYRNAPRILLSTGDWNF